MGNRKACDAILKAAVNLMIHMEIIQIESLYRLLLKKE